MDAINNNRIGVSSRGNLTTTIKDNSDGIVEGGGAATVTLATINRSAEIGNKVTRAVSTSSRLSATRKADIIELFSKIKIFKRFPILKKVAGPLAKFAGLTTVVGAVAKIADTGNFVEKNAAFNAQG